MPRSYELKREMSARCASPTTECRPPEQVSKAAMITGQICDCSLPKTAAKVVELAHIFPTEDVLRMTTTIRIWSQWMDAQLASDAAALLLFPKPEPPTPQESTVLITAAQAILKKAAIT